MRNWEELIDPESESREKFFAYLLRKTSTRKQAQEYLRRMKLPESLMNEAEDAGLIDDSAYAKLFAEGHTSWGNAKISYELSMRGVSRENIRLALDEIADETERAREISEGLRESGIDDRKIAARLMSRGFTNRAVNEALRK
ncbi:MAG: RecX family transcriptional regulator [Synergistaceae bacterium]|nr:RecX family transcriptional regulator [Synergistaceae bacterium]MBR0167924.1 RecX family transcriptional regulator [Synergistaceae bacterium]